MRALPQGWVPVSIRDVAAPWPGSLTDGPFGSNLKTEHYAAESGPRVIRLQNIGDLEFRGEDEAFITEEHFRTLRKHAVEAGDVLIAGLGDVLPRVCVAPTDIEKAIVKADCFRLRCAPGIDPKFIQFALSAPHVRQSAATRISGVGRPRLNLRKLGSLTIPLPPSAEQERIVKAVEEELSRLDVGLAALNRIGRNVERMRAAVLHAAVTGAMLMGPGAPPDGELPAGWSWRTLDSIITRLRNGVFVSRPVTEQVGPPILRISAVRPMALDIDDVRYVPPSRHPSRAEEFFLEEGDLLFTRYSGNPGYVGACAIVPRGVQRLLYPDKLIRVQVDRAIVEPRFVEIAASTGRTRRAIHSRVKTTAGQTGISGADLKAVPFPIPPVEVQREIIEQVDDALAKLARLEEQLARGARRSASLRSSILMAASSGALVPQDPDDEPVSKLLDRIAADREKSARRRGRARSTRGAGCAA